MRKITTSLTFFILTGFFILTISTAQAQQSTISKDRKKLITVEDAWLRFTFYPSYVRGLRSLNDGIHYTSLSHGKIEKYKYENGEKVSTLLNQNELEYKGEKIEIEDYQFNRDESKILITTEKKPIYRHSYAAKNFVWDLKSKKLIAVADGKLQQLASFSPEGNRLAYVRNNNLYTFDLSTEEEKQITTDGEKNRIINGAPDWVYEEEFSFAKAFQWSPDGKKIAFYKFDESKVKLWSMKMYGDLYPEIYEYKYPKAGEDNSVVSIHVFDLESGKTIKMDIGDETDQYIPRILWTKEPNTLSIQRLNRLQNKLELLMANATDGKSKVIYTETNKYYVDITDNLTFLDDKKHFIWTSEKDGYNHIYLFDISGKEIRQITKGEWDVVKLYGVDEKRDEVFYQSAESSPTQRDVYKIRLDGKKKKKITKNEGTNNAHFSKTFDFYINQYSNANTPDVFTLHNYKGKKIRVLEDNKRVSERLEKYRFSRKDFFTFETSEGVELNGWMIKPYNFTPDREYPVFMTVYGGPGANTVNDAWEYNMIWHQVIAQHGYIVVSVDPRGTGMRGEEFKKQTYLQLGKYETIDMIEAAKYLGELEYVDENRIGIQGWSYGGYLSSLSLFKGADYFKMAIAVAPVTNWRYYDNIYTERFMRTPQENPDGYDDNSPINFVKELKGGYLLIHGSADDNVHYQNTMMLAKALNDAGKQYDMHIYPNRNHSIFGGRTRYQLFTKMTNFILDEL